MEWQTIDTAPDGEWVLVKVKGDDIPVVAKSWKAGYEEDSRVEHWTWISDLRFARAEYEHPFCVLENVTHWMHFPVFSEESCDEK